MKLTKKFRFEAAHRLAKGYSGKCANLHGHSWNGHIEIDVKSLDAFDMGVDFYHMGEFIKFIEDRFDHKILLYEKDEAIVSFCYQQEYAIELFTANPTCEVIAQDILELLRAFFFQKKDCNRRISGYAVRIEETCTTSCTAV